MDAEELGPQCERVYLQALCAMARRHPDAADLAELSVRLAGAEERARTSRGRMHAVAARVGLGPDHLDLFWAIVAVTVDPRITPHAQAIAGPHVRRGLSLDLYAELAELSGERARSLASWMSASNPLLAYGLVVEGESGPVIAARSFTVPRRVIAYLCGDDAFDPALERHANDRVPLFAANQRAALALLEHVLSGGSSTLIVVEGAPDSGRCTAVARSCALPLAILDARREASTFVAGLFALRREVALSGTVPVIADADEITHDAGAAAALARFVEGHHGPVVVTTSVGGALPAFERPIVRVRWPTPDVAARVELWRKTAGEVAGIDDLAVRYPLSAGAITRAVASARAVTTGPLDATALVRGVRHNIAERLGGIAHRVEVTQSWDDLVLADDTWEQVRALIARVRHSHEVLERWGYRAKMARGTGVPILFSGPPGTGKTMVAGLIARELELDLYQVDLANVVSKWIGETEKQLAKLFDAAEEGHALLLFDEADALFGQRTTETRGATDRYSNLEVNFLLQRVEAFGGITILTTNLETSIDRALKRRLASHIVFAAPDEDERTTLWSRMITTAKAPLEANLDLAELARAFPTMTGANIRNAALSAAYLAAADGGQIGQAHLLRAARSEYRSMGHVLADRGQGSARRL